MDKMLRLHCSYPKEGSGYWLKDMVDLHFSFKRASFDTFCTQSIVWSSAGSMHAGRIHAITPTVVNAFWKSSAACLLQVQHSQFACGKVSSRRGEPAWRACLSSAAGGLVYFKMAWWVSHSRASYHQLSKSTAVLRLLWSDWVEKWVSVWGEISGRVWETYFLSRFGHKRRIAGILITEIKAALTCLWFPIGAHIWFLGCNSYCFMLYALGCGFIRCGEAEKATSHIRFNELLCGRYGVNFKVFVLYVTFYMC